MKTFLSSLLGTLSAIVLVLLIGVGFVTCATGEQPAIKKGSYLVVELHGDLLEYDPPGGLVSQVTQGSTETLQRVLDGLWKATVDDRIDGVVIKLSASASIGQAKMTEIRNAMRGVQEAGKPVHAWAESFDENDYYLLAACDRIVAPPTAYIGFKGFSSTSMHVKRALELIGIKPNIHKIKDYKSAAELVTREHMSEPARENADWLFDDLWAMFVESLGGDRGLNEEQILALMDHAMFTAEAAKEGGLIDEIQYWDELEATLKRDRDDELRTVSQARYAEETAASLGLKGKHKIAVIHAQGTITGRQSTVNPLLGVTMGHETIVRELRRARLDDRVAAVILRVDSPGGEALSSDLMGHAVELTAAVKPVVVSMVDVAASGGYHISYRATKIVADPTTVTGSIGSITGKFNMSELYDKLGITYDELARGPKALIDSSLRDYTPEERARFEEDHWDGFNAWLRDVAEHRGMEFEEAELLAHGRVWTGRQALANGLVDELGDLSHAVDVAKRLAEIPEDKQVTLRHYPVKKTLVQSLMGGEGDVAAAANWLLHRYIRDDVIGTLERLANDPNLVPQYPMP